MSKGWLSTGQAAKRLGVSEASVRRWSDRGLLPVQRVGKRLERRFKPGHLERFAAPARPRPPPPSHIPPVAPGGPAGAAGSPPPPPFHSDPAPAPVGPPLP